MLELAFRQALSTDAAALGDFMARNFRAAYGHTASPENIAAAIAGNYGESAQQRQLLDANNFGIIASAGDELVGHALLNLAELPAVGTVSLPSIEIARFYVDSRFHGRGVAQAMMDRVKREARARGAASLWLSVAQIAAQAIRFYEKSGFRIAGELIYMLGDDPKDDWLMVFDLAS